MTLTGPALRVTILIGENDTFHHRPLHSEIVHREDRVRAFLPQLDSLVTGGLVTVDEADVLRYADARNGKPDAGHARHDGSAE